MFWSIVGFLVVITVIVFIHELGHFLVARFFKMRVTVFSIGMGPRAIGFERGGTDYRVSWLPLGGYVNLGENILVPTNDSDAFVNKPRWQRMLVLFAGPGANILLALVLLTIVFSSGYSVPAPVASASMIVAGVVAGSPAEAVGIRIGDEIKAVDGVRVADRAAFSVELNRAREGTWVAVTLERGDTLQTVLVTPNGASGKKYVGIYLGGAKFGSAKALSVDHVVIAVAQYSFVITGETFATIAKIFSGEQAARENLAGPIGIAHISGRVLQAGMMPLVYFIAMISLAVAIMNLLPFPVLDGGWIAFLLIESVARRDIPMRVKAAINKTGLAFLLILTVYITYADIVRILSS